VKQVVEEGAGTGLLRRALEAALAAIMEGEVSELTGAAYGERSEERQTYRNGYRPRQLDTPLGTSELQIPKLREGTYLPSFLRARQRSDESLLLALVECFQQGVSTRAAERVAIALGVEAISKSTVSRILTVLEPQVEAFRKRALSSFPYVYLDARYENVRENHRIEKMAVLIGVGVREDGSREVLGYWVAPTENEAYWSDFLQDLRQRGLDGVKLVISDAHEGLRAAIRQKLPGAKWQRCKVHFLRNVAGRLPAKKRPALMALVKTMFAQDRLEDALRQRRQVVEGFHRARLDDVADFIEQADEVLTYMSFPAEHATKLNSTNMLERLNRELKTRTRVVSIFPNRASLIRLVGALLLEENDEWLVARRYIGEQSMKLLAEPKQTLDVLPAKNGPPAARSALAPSGARAHTRPNPNGRGHNGGSLRQAAGL
jgi:transposase-like protein